MAALSSSLPVPWHFPSDVQVMWPNTYVALAARLLTLKDVVPLETLYCEIIQLGIVRDLSVQRPAGQVGTAGISMAKVLATNAVRARSTALPILATEWAVSSRAL